MKPKHYAKGMTQAEYMRWWRKEQQKIKPLLTKLHSAQVIELRPSIESVLKRVIRGHLGRRAAATVILKIIEAEVEKNHAPSSKLTASSS